MKKNNSIRLSKLEKYFVTVCLNAQGYELSPEASAKYFMKEWKRHFKMPNLNFDFQSLYAIEKFIQRHFRKLHFWTDYVAQVYGIIYGHTLVECLGGIWMYDVYNDDEPSVCFEFNTIAPVLPVLSAKKFLLKYEIGPTHSFYEIVINGRQKSAFHPEIKKLLPDIGFFKKLDKKLQWAVVTLLFKSCAVAERNTPTHKIGLLQVNDFYIEHRVNKKNLTENYRAFDASSKWLQPYLTSITIPNF